MEFSVIITEAHRHYKAGRKTVLATIVGLDGSSYRKPGARMLMTEDGQMTFALSGGCIEMYVFRQAEEVFATGKAKVITYDGRERLGCEGLLYILLERVEVDEELYNTIMELESNRQAFDLVSRFEKANGVMGDFGTFIKIPKSFGDIQDNQKLNRETIKLRTVNSVGQGHALDLQNREKIDNAALDQFIQTIHPPFKLLLFGSGHDVQSFSKLAANLGWAVTVVICDESPRQPGDFPAATRVVRATGTNVKDLQPDSQTAAVVMTHNFEKDADYLMGLLESDCAYVGMIGSLKRKTMLEDRFRMVGQDPAVLKNVYTPAGLDIGAETPEEIAVSIIAEILATIRKRDGQPLKNLQRARIGSLTPH